MNRTSILFFLLLSFRCATAQQLPLGNEWINYQQTYFKIPVAQNGLYRITTAELQRAGVPVSSVNPITLQLFHRGTEQAIYVEGEADNRLDATDFVEFYGRGNDGAQDSLLYRPYSAQPHKYYSLFSDTTAYFLTWRLDSKPGKRMAAYTDTDPGSLKPEPYHWEEELRVFTEMYPGWAAGIPPKIEYSHFEAGEGYTGLIQQKGKFYDNNFTLNNAFQTGPAPGLDVLLAGREYTYHTVSCHVGSSINTRRLLSTVSFPTYDNARIAGDLLWSDIGSDGRLLISTVSRSDFQANDPYSVSYIRLRYPQRLVGNGLSLRTYRLVPNASGRSLLTIENVAASSRFWDISDPNAPIRVGSTDRSGGSVELIVRNTENSRTILSSSQPKTVIAVSPVQFTNWSNRKPTYLIISHPALMKPAAEYADAVKAYAAYRASAQGGGHDTLTTTIQQLFDQFSYGERHPLAIRRFADKLLQQSVAAPKRPGYLLLIGRSRSTPGVRRDPNQSSIDLVLTAGFPGSDHVFTAGLDGEPQDVPAIPTGRINAVTPQQVVDYLKKVIEYEALPADQPWRKKLLHLSGGENPYETVLFRGLLDSYQNIVINESLGAKVATLSKQTDNPVENVSIVKSVNEGVGMISFFGHSGLDVTDLDIGFCSNDALGYANKGKYPFMLFNGCAVGNIFYSRPTLSSDWILTPNRGAIAVMASSHLGYVGVLNRYTQQFYHLLSDSTYLYKSIGQIQQETARRVLAQNPDGWDLANAQQFVLQGDPAVRLFPFEIPDYSPLAGSLTVQSSNNQSLTTLSDSVRLRVVLRNYGQYRQGRLPMRVRRLVNGRESGVYNFLLPQTVAFIDTLTLTIPNERNAEGLNQFEVVVNPNNSLRELNYGNNSTRVELNVAGQGPVLIYPPLGGTVATRSIRLTAQYLTQGSHTFDLELDTNPEFNSTTRLVQRITADRIISYPTLLSAEPGKIYYWRIRESDTTPKAWSLGSFRYDPVAKGLQLPEGQIRLAGSLPTTIQQGDQIVIPIQFTNLSPYSYTDSLTVQQTIYAAGLTQPLVRRWRVSAPGAGDTLRFTTTIQTDQIPGTNQLLLTVNPQIQPEYSFINNTLDLPLFVEPDLLGPILEVAIDGARIENGAPVSAQPVIDILVADDNRALIRRDTVGLNLFLQRPGTNSRFERLAWRTATIQSASTANVFRLRYPSPPLTEGLYHLLVTARDALGNAATPYQVSFQVINERKLTDLTVYPNPFRDQVLFAFRLTGTQAPDRIELTITDLKGRIVRRLQTGQSSLTSRVGLNEWLWDGRADSGEPLPAGLYLYQLSVHSADQPWPVTDEVNDHLRGRLVLTR